MYTNINRLFSTGLHDIKPGLERIDKFLRLVGSPHEKVNYVLVGGTNGKCSVATAIARIMQYNSYRTGLYTSPHLTDVTERFSIDGQDITKQRLDTILGSVFELCDKNDIPLSYFELVTAAAFIYFREEEIDLGVLEVGMGGRWDATNVTTPLVSVITNVSYDHMQYLGSNLRDIATEKACIMRKNGKALTGSSGEPLEVIRKFAGEISCELYTTEDDFVFTRSSSSRFNYKGLSWDLDDLEIRLKGIHQINNIILSIGCVEILNKYFSYNVNPGKLRAALKNVEVPGRMEYLRDHPPVILDGAHNEAAAQELVRSISDVHGDTKFVFLVAMLKDKDHESYVKKIAAKASEIIITRINDERCENAGNLYKIFSKYHDKIEVIEDPVYAFEKCLKAGQPLCVTGSLYLIGFLKRRIKDEKNRFCI